ncbi:Putative nitrilotriacetate monooxygenase [Komagataella phaffii CBS 7435]|uniref:Luciferase-like domain-containing protein n=2 Tax=Komagataella phaffii TaxID=460519 RepID=C4QYG5_KOMPG|nr:uncharacterized protein PAS_chr1-4_0681 [Komagataella phaffii GS115]AOA61106.1 GQ67_01720T0 [Komagataella phaffii]CAH2447111.1 Putative nitrilotriacetate monooxygenase [Komagataella phaffii CBS 7435]AOA66098.1 GQ68_01735T0 [Komagataella phaffii GS115]CAY68288.1 hypothetical protein PAS_chr1-4_0681 [Komagataella phaffii GS115]SCV11914.1 Putative nitrilotriacetate monooxygenase [Komagataella phaffii CBS 7435]
MTKENEAKRQKTSQPKAKKQLIINAFMSGSSGNQSPGLWSYPGDKSTEYTTLDYWVELAQKLEKAKFHSIFIADVLGGYDVYNGPGNYSAAAKSGAQFPMIEPSAAVTAMAAATKSITFGVTFSTISEAPYHFARRLGTLDLLTNGRVGWNIVSSYLDSAARNLLNGEPLPLHADRYKRAEEFLQVVYRLFLSSWRDDAYKLDKKTRTFADPKLIRTIDHVGEFFNVPGPQFLPPTPQRLPLILQAGTSKVGMDYAAKHAEVVFLASFDPESLQEKIKTVRDIAETKYNRPRDSIKFLILITVVIADTHEDAVKRYEDLASYADLEGAQALFSGWTGIDIGKYGEDEPLEHVESNAIKSHVKNWTKFKDNKPRARKDIAKQIGVGGSGPLLVGSVQEIADELERWAEVSDLDGFNFAYADYPQTFDDIIEKLLPELNKRGVFWDDYKIPGGTFRESVFGRKFVDKDHPAYDLRWRSDQTREEFEKKLAELEKK